MIPLPPALAALPWRALGVAALVTLVAVAGWRVTAWRAAYRALPAAQEALQREIECRDGSKCSERVIAAAQAARDAEAVRQSEALAGVQAREEKARRDAEAWRARYRAAREADPECAAWSAQRIACPL